MKETPYRPDAQDINLKGEPAEGLKDAPAGGNLRVFQKLNLRIEPGGGLNWQ